MFDPEKARRDLEDVVQIICDQLQVFFNNSLKIGESKELVHDSQWKYLPCLVIWQKVVLKRPPGWWIIRLGRTKTGKSLVFWITEAVDESRELFAAIKDPRAQAIIQEELEKFRVSSGLIRITINNPEHSSRWQT